jgi:hypothetical protein
VERFGVYGHTSHEALVVNQTGVGSCDRNRRAGRRSQSLDTPALASNLRAVTRQRPTSPVLVTIPPRRQLPLTAGHSFRPKTSFSSEFPLVSEQQKTLHSTSESRVIELSVMTSYLLPGPPVRLLV